MTPANSQVIDDSGLEPKSIERLERKIRHRVGRAVSDFGMIEGGDRIMVCVSGGADSYTLLEMDDLATDARRLLELNFPEHPVLTAEIDLDSDTGKDPGRWFQFWE